MKRILNLLLVKLSNIKIGKGLLLNTITFPELLEANHNLFWGFWLFLKSLSYIKKGLIIKHKIYKEKYLWYRTIVILIKFIIPISIIVKLLKAYRLLRYLISFITIFPILIYSPADLVVFCHTVYLTIISNWDYLTSFLYTKYLDILDLFFNKMEDFKDSIESKKSINNSKNNLIWLLE